MTEYEFNIKIKSLILRGDSSSQRSIEIMCKPHEDKGGYTLAWIKPHKEGGVDVHSIGCRAYLWDDNFDYEDFVKLVIIANDLFKERG